MTTIQLNELKQLGVTGVIKRYLPRIGKTPEEGGITRDQYAQLIKLVAPVVERATSQEPQGLTQLEEYGHQPSSDPTPYSRPPEQHQPAPAQLSEHGDKAKGKSQKARLLALLQDHEPHTTLEIMTKVYKVGEDRGIARIASRISELRKEGHNIETIRLTQTLTAYKLV